MSEATIREIDVRRAQLMVELAKSMGKSAPERIRRLATAKPTTKD